MPGELNSTSAISAALRMAWPMAPALPPADSGRTRPTLKSPVPIAAGAAGADGAEAERSTEFSVLVQPAKPVAAASVAARAAGRHRQNGLKARVFKKWA